MNIRALFPVQFARSRNDEMDKQEYDDLIAQNENNMNQNFEILMNAILELSDIIERGGNSNG